MGNSQGRAFGGRLSKKDVERLQRRFMRLADGRTTVPIPRFLDMVELGGNPFISTIFQMFDTDKDSCLSLDEFTKALEYFGQLEVEEEQYKFAFRLYDRDGDGKISSTELFDVLHKMLGHQYNEPQLEQVVYNTMAEFDRDGDNSLNFEEFKLLLSSTDLQNKFALSM